MVAGPVLFVLIEGMALLSVLLEPEEIACVPRFVARKACKFSLNSAFFACTFNVVQLSEKARSQFWSQFPFLSDHTSFWLLLKKTAVKSSSQPIAAKFNK